MKEEEKKKTSNKARLECKLDEAPERGRKKATENETLVSRLVSSEERVERTVRRPLVVSTEQILRS